MLNRKHQINVVGSLGHERSFLQKLIDRIFGFDFFICYTWADGRLYAASIASLLERDGYKCFWDRKDYFAGDDLVVDGGWALAKTQNLVLIGTPLASSRKAVLRELGQFSKTKRKVIPVDLGGCPQELPANHPFLPYLPETVIRINTDPSEVHDGPSERTVKEIKRAFEGKRQNQKRLRAFITATIVLTILTIIATTSAIRAHIATYRAKRETANTAWLFAQASRNSSTIRSTHLFLRCAETLSSIHDARNCRDAELAAQCESALLCHSWLEDSPVVGCAFSPDGSQIASWGLDGKLRILTANNSYRSEVYSNSEAVIGASFNSDGSKVLSWSANGTVQIRDLTEHSAPKVFKHDGAVNGAIFAFGESRLLTWSSDDLAILWDATNQSQVRAFRHSNSPISLRASFGFAMAQQQQQNEICSAALNKEESLVVTTGSDATARLWSITNSAPLYIFTGSGVIRGTTFVDKGGYVICWGDRGMVWFRSISTNYSESLHSVDVPTIKGVELDHEQKSVLSWSDEGTINLREFPSGRLLASLHQNGSVNGAKFLHNDSEILSWGADGIAVLWNAADGKRIGEFKHSGPISGAVINSEKDLLLTYSDDGSARLWRISDESLIQIYEHQGPIHGAVFAPKTSQVLTWGEDGVVRLWNLEARASFSQYKLTEPTVGGCFTSDGSKLLTWSAHGIGALWVTNASNPTWVFDHGTNFSGITTVSGSSVVSWGSDGTIKMWSTNSRSPIRTFSLGKSVDGVSTSGNDGHLLAWSRDGVVVWDAKRNDEVNRFPVYGILGASFAPRGLIFLTWNSEGTINVWEVGNTQPIMTCNHDGAVLGVTWRANADQFLTWSIDGTAKIWFMDKSKPAQILRHSRSVKGAVYSRDGKYVLTWGLDNKAKLWRIGVGEPVKEFSHNKRLLGAMFHSDGISVWTWTGDGMIRLWNGEGPANIFQQPGPALDIRVDEDGDHFLTLGADDYVRYWSINHKEPICTIPNLGPVQGADLRSSKEGILTWDEYEGARLWDFSVDNRSKIDERVLEFEVRSATALGVDGQEHVLNANELKTKQIHFEKLAGNRSIP